MTENNRGRGISYGSIIIFWAPLVLMRLMMAVEQPALTAVIARLSEAEINLASFGVMMAVALVIESPIIQMFSAATALAGSRQNYQKLLKAMNILAVVLTLVHLIVGLTPLFNLILRHLLAVPEEVIEISRRPFLIMTPFSAAVGYRRLWQGTLIRYGRTGIIPVTMASRFIVIGAVLGIGYALSYSGGAELAALGLSLGVTAAAFTAWFFYRKQVYPYMPEQDDSGDNLDTRGFLKFYIPLAMTSVIFLFSRPLLTLGIARSADPVKSLAAWPVINAFLFLFNAVALSFQEAVIALMGRDRAYRPKLKRFTLVLALSLSGLTLLVGLTPLSRMWFRGVSGLSDDLLAYTRVPVLILAVVPGLVTLKSWLRGQFVAEKHTGVMAKSVTLYTVILFVSVFFGPLVFTLTGTVLASLCLVLAQGIENGYLSLYRFRIYTRQKRRAAGSGSVLRKRPCS